MTEFPGDNQARHQLGEILLYLMRFSCTSVEEAATRVGLPASKVLKILSGESFPSWAVTERFAHSCGADVLILRKIWEDERKRQTALLPTGCAMRCIGPGGGIRGSG